MKTTQYGENRRIRQEGNGGGNSRGIPRVAAGAKRRTKVQLIRRSIDVLSLAPAATRGMESTTRPAQKNNPLRHNACDEGVVNSNEQRAYFFRRSMMRLSATEHPCPLAWTINGLMSHSAISG
jgi:hypothetical protein